MMGGWDNAPEYGGNGGWRSTALAVIVFVFVTGALVLWKLSEAAAQSPSIVGVASVIDGDTIEIHGEHIRLSGFDSPERGSMCGASNVYQRASLALADFIGARTVSCIATGRDSYNRITAQCGVGSMDLGGYMVSLGWARDWPRYSGGEYADEEAAARASRLGIWGMDCPADLWGQRDYSNTGAPPSSATASPPTAVSLEVAYVSASALNVRAGPGPENAVIGRLPHRSRVEVHERSGEWARVAATNSEAGGWVSSDYLSANEPIALAESPQSDARIRSLVIERSLAGYSGSCPCPYNVDRGGRRCGERSAYSRPGGASPICYPSDVTAAQIRALRTRAQ